MTSHHGREGSEGLQRNGTKLGQTPLRPAQSRARTSLDGFAVTNRQTVRLKQQVVGKKENPTDGQYVRGVVAQKTGGTEDRRSSGFTDCAFGAAYPRLPPDPTRELPNEAVSFFFLRMQEEKSLLPYLDPGNGLGEGATAAALAAATKHSTARRDGTESGEERRGGKKNIQVLRLP